MKAVAIVSGGMDSITLAHHLVKERGVNELHMLAFNYGQRHLKELFFAQTHAEQLGAQFDVIHMPSSFMAILAGSDSVLTNRNIEVPDGHYTDLNMRATVVPNRNMMMLSLAAAVAVAEKGEFVATGVHGGDHFIYPDCRPRFIELVSATIAEAMPNDEGFGHWTHGPVYAPFLHIGKHDIAAWGAKLGVDFTTTWSCYKGGDIHCGRCGTCVERKEAFRLAEVIDPTEYEDPTFEIRAYRG